MLTLENDLGMLRPGRDQDRARLLHLAETNDLFRFGDPHWRPANHSDFTWPRFEAGQSSRFDLVIDTNKWGVIGTCCLHQIDWRNRNASVGITIYDENKRNRGVGTAVLAALQEWSSRTLSMRRLEAYILNDNHVSVRLFKGCGFELEGTLRKRYLRQGEPVDVLIYGWLSNE